MFKLPAKMAALKIFTIALAMVLLSSMAEAIHHHVDGDDLAAWASARVFKVGDNIWFANTASKGSLVELESVDEFSSCDLTNPIKMYTEDINQVYLDGEGSRFFVSGDMESCKKGVKLHINVHPKEETNEEGSSEDEDAPEIIEPPPSPKPKPKPPHKAPPPEFEPDSPTEPDYPTPDFPPPTPSSSTMLSGLTLVLVTLACWVAI